MTEHIGENAALYALGLLDAGDARDVEGHLLRCDACRRLLAQAEADVTALSAAQPQLDPPTKFRSAPSSAPARAWWNSRTLAYAAVLAVALLPSGFLLRQNVAMHEEMLANSAAISRVMSTPHRTVAFAGADAHVMYGKDGSWYVVVIRGAVAPLHVLWPHDGTTTMLGTAVPRGDVAMLYLPQSHRMEQLALESGGRVVGHAQLAF